MGPNRTREWDYVTGSAESGGLTFLPSEVLQLVLPGTFSDVSGREKDRRRTGAPP